MKYLSSLSIKLYKFFKKLVKKNRYFFWSLFHPDNLFEFKYANKAEVMTWEFIKKRMSCYKSICEIGCFNGRITFILKEFLNKKTYIGYDLNLIAIFIAKFVNYFSRPNKNFFYFLNGTNSAKQNCQLFVSVATLIYFTEMELKSFIKSLKKNKTFKCLVMHEIFLNENISNTNKTLVEDNMNIHSISMIKEEFGKNYRIKILRTFYSNWESKERISAILSVIKK